MGDHLAFKGGPLQGQFDILSSQRSIFNLFVSEDKSFLKTRDFLTHFDMFPTILEFIGFQVLNAQLGLGYSAFSHEHNLSKDDHFEKLDAALAGTSESYKALWRTSAE